MSKFNHNSNTNSKLIIYITPQDSPYVQYNSALQILLILKGIFEQLTTHGCD